MEFSPPVSERTDKELFNIISNDEKWTNEIQLLAEEELYRRNFTRESVLKEKNKRLTILNEYRERQTRKFEKNRKESYTIIEMFLIVIFFPFSLILRMNPLSEFWELDANNYKKKIWQRVLLILTSLFLWFQFLRLLL